MNHERTTTPTNADDIDFSNPNLLDLRVDYAFKLFFTTGGTHRLKSLLNAIFENKQIPRIVSSLAVVNPSLEKAAVEDKLSVLDIRAILSDGTTVCVEMHLYDLLGLKYKSLRSWARAYGEELAPGQRYQEQNMVVCISFLDGPVTDAAGNPIEKVHSLFQVMERDSHDTLLPDLEMHYINMKAFVKHCEEMEASVTDHDMFTQWLAMITQKGIKDKEKIKRICAGEEMQDAMETLTNLSQDKIKRQAYQRRLDELYFYNKMVCENEEYYHKITEQSAALSDKDAALAEQSAALADKDAALADKDAEIVRLRAQLGERSK